MRSNAKCNWCSFITVVSVCFPLSAFVLPIPVYADGEIVAWGDNWSGQCNVPSPNKGFAAIAAGNGHSLGLKGCLYNLAGDLNDDCEVDMLDFAIMADNWLVDCTEEPSNPACVHK